MRDSQCGPDEPMGCDGDFFFDVFISRANLASANLFPPLLPSQLPQSTGMVGVSLANAEAPPLLPMLTHKPFQMDESGGGARSHRSPTVLSPRHTLSSRQGGVNYGPSFNGHGLRAAEHFVPTDLTLSTPPRSPLQSRGGGRQVPQPPPVLSSSQSLSASQLAPQLSVEAKREFYDVIQQLRQSAQDAIDAFECEKNRTINVLSEYYERRVRQLEDEVDRLTRSLTHDTVITRSMVGEEDSEEQHSGPRSLTGSRKGGKRKGVGQFRSKRLIDGDVSVDDSDMTARRITEALIHILERRPTAVRSRK